MQHCGGSQETRCYMRRVLALNCPRCRDVVTNSLLVLGMVRRSARTHLYSLHTSDENVKTTLQHASQRFPFLIPVRVYFPQHDRIFPLSTTVRVCISACFITPTWLRPSSFVRHGLDRVVQGLNWYQIVWPTSSVFRHLPFNQFHSIPLLFAMTERHSVPDTTLVLTGSGVLRVTQLA